MAGKVVCAAVYWILGLGLSGEEVMGEGRWSCREGVRGRWWGVLVEAEQGEIVSVLAAVSSAFLCKKNTDW